MIKKVKYKNLKNIYIKFKRIFYHSVSSPSQPTKNNKITNSIYVQMRNTSKTILPINTLNILNHLKQVEDSIQPTDQPLP